MLRSGLWPLNLSTTITKFDVFIPQMNAGVKARVKALAEQIFDDSQHVSPTCPIETGRLISTGRVEPANATGRTYVAGPSGGGGAELTASSWAVVYGGTAFDGTEVDYANQVHDDLRPRRYTVPGSGPKFIEIHWLRRTDTADEELETLVMDLVNASFQA